MDMRNLYRRTTSDLLCRAENQGAKIVRRRGTSSRTDGSETLDHLRMETSMDTE